MKYICNNCGYSPNNRSTWCDLGCGNDYNEMIAIPDNIAKKIERANAIEKALIRLCYPDGQGVSINILGEFEGYGYASEKWDMTFTVRHGSFIYHSERHDGITELAMAINKACDHIEK